MRRNSPRGSWSWWRLRRRSLRSVLILTRYIVMHRDTTSSPDRFPSLWARLGHPARLGACGAPQRSPQSMHPMAMTEDELRAITVGELRPLADKIEIAEYDPAWPATYARQAVRIRAAL